jgi:hypothetical protein
MTAMDSRGQALKANAVVFLILTSIALLVRIWIRLKTSKRFWVDDWLLLVAVVSLLKLKSLNSERHILTDI